MMVNAIGLEVKLDNVALPIIEGYLLSNQGKRIKCRVTTDDRGNIVFSPIKTVEEDSDRRDHD